MGEYDFEKPGFVSGYEAMYVRDISHLSKLEGGEHISDACSERLLPILSGELREDFVRLDLRPLRKLCADENLDSVGCGNALFECTAPLIGE
eukprot:3034924-Alexandrium_andersonii.AAC.1